MTTVFSEHEFVLISYVLGVSFVIWSIGSSAFSSLILIFPFISYLLLISSKLNINGNILNESKNLILAGIAAIGNIIILICTVWLVNSFISFLVIGNYVMFFLISSYIAITGLILYIFIKWYNFLMWGVLPLILFFMNININIIMIAVALIGTLIV